MGLAKMLAVVAFLASACGAMLYRTDTQCDFTDVTIDDQVFSRLIARLPESIESGPQRYHELLPGHEVGGLTVEGLNRMRACGPAIPYCTNAIRMVQVDFYTDGDTYFSSPWKACTGDEGRILIRAMFTRFTLQFRIVESTAAGVKLELVRLLPVTMQGVHFDIEGAGRGVRGAFEILSYPLQGVTKELWRAEFSRSVNKAFRVINE